jgi:hypothetical protein
VSLDLYLEITTMCRKTARLAPAPLASGQRTEDHERSLMHYDKLISINNNSFDRKTMCAYPSAHSNGAPPSQSNQRTFKMTPTNMIQIVDRFALSLMNALVLVGLPLVAVGLLTQSL